MKKAVKFAEEALEKGINIDGTKLSPQDTKKLAGEISDVMKAYDVSYEDAKQALTVKWSKEWCPVLPSFFRGEATTLCEIRDSLSDLAVSYNLDFNKLLKGAKKLFK